MAELTTFSGYAVVELFGHTRLAGEVSTQEIAGAAFLRVDVPLPGGQAVTRFYNPSAVYSLTPCDEATARAVAAHHQPAVVQRYEPAPPTAAGSRRYAEGSDDDDDTF